MCLKTVSCVFGAGCHLGKAVCPAIPPPQPQVPVVQVMFSCRKDEKPEVKTLEEVCEARQVLQTPYSSLWSP